MTATARIEAAVTAELERQRRGLDALIDVASVSIVVYLNPGGCTEIDLRPQMRAKAERRR